MNTDHETSLSDLNSTLKNSHSHLEHIKNGIVHSIWATNDFSYVVYPIYYPKGTRYEVEIRRGCGETFLRNLSDWFQQHSSTINIELEFSCVEKSNYSFCTLLIYDNTNSRKSLLYYDQASVAKPRVAALMATDIVASRLIEHYVKLKDKCAKYLENILEDAISDIKKFEFISDTNSEEFQSILLHSLQYSLEEALSNYDNYLEICKL